MRLKRGQYVRHSKDGWGTILERSDNQTTVYFRTIGIKRLATPPRLWVRETPQRSAQSRIVPQNELHAQIRPVATFTRFATTRPVAGAECRTRPSSDQLSQGC